MTADRGRWIWLDDVRREPVGWERAHTAAECITLLKRGGVDIVSLDHDLSEEQQIVDWDDYCRAEEPTGYTVARWIEKCAADGAWNLVPLTIVCHSANPSGKARIEACIASIMRMQQRAGQT